MAAVPPLPVDFGPLRSRTSAGQATRQLSTSELNQREWQPSPSETIRDNTKPQPQAQSIPRAQRHSTSYDCSDDEILVPMRFSALTEALLNESGSGAEYATPRERPASPTAQPPPRVSARRSVLAAHTPSTLKDHGNPRESVWPREIKENAQAADLQLPPAKPTSPAASESRGSSPAPTRRVVRLSRTPGRGTIQEKLRHSISTSTPEIRLENRKGSSERESHFQTRAEMDERQLNQENIQTGIKTPVSLERTARASVGSSRRSIRSAGSAGSAGSAAITSRRFGADSDAITPAKPAAEERAHAGDDVGNVSRGDNSGKREHVELRSTTRPKRVIGVSGSLLGGPARRRRRSQTEDDAEAHSEELLDAAQDPEQNAIASSSSKSPISTALSSPFQRRHPLPAANGTRVSLARLSDIHVQRTASNSESPRHEPVPSPKIPSVHANEVQASEQANARRVSTIVSTKEASKPASPPSLDKGSFAPQRAPISSERRASAVKSQSTPYLPTSSLPPPRTAVVETLTTTQSTKKKQPLMRVNSRAYAKIDCIGRGGSGKVYRVATANGTVLALKRVSLPHMDEHTEKSLRVEIELLRQLRGVERVIQLMDYEMNREKQSLSVLMEVGELDFNTLLKNRQSGSGATHIFDITFVRYYWKEMLECVRAIHARAVVHSDLKPANFVLVKGRLKLIDFGIANAIQTDVTANVHRESMAGTINYMSPESLMDSTQYAFTVIQSGHPYIPASGAPRLVKVGKPSDIWSLGCILYQMVYGIPPFGKLPEPRSRIQAIVNWSNQIEFPATTEDGSCVPVALLQTMRRCLSRDQKDRPTCETLLSEDNEFVYPKDYDMALSAPEDGQFLPVTEELLGRVIQSVRIRCREGLPQDKKALAAWTKAYWASLEKAVA